MEQYISVSHWGMHMTLLQDIIDQAKKNNEATSCMREAFQMMKECLLRIADGSLDPVRDAQATLEAITIFAIEMNEIIRGKH